MTEIFRVNFSTATSGSRTAGVFDLSSIPGFSGSGESRGIDTSIVRERLWPPSARQTPESRRLRDRDRSYVSDELGRQADFSFVRGPVTQAERGEGLFFASSDSHSFYLFTRPPPSRRAGSSRNLLKFFLSSVFFLLFFLGFLFYDLLLFSLLQNGHSTRWQSPTESHPTTRD